MLGSVKWIAAGGIVVAALGGALWATAQANGTLRDRVEQLEAEQQELRQANAANVVTIDDLIARNNLCVEERRVDESANQTLVAQLQSDLEALRRRPRIVREEIYRDPSCAELGALDIAAVCPAIAVGLRERASILGSD